MAKILVIEKGEATPLEQVKFTEEGKLQDYLEKYPSLIPWGDVVEGASDLLCIGREVGVLSGSIDLLFIDKDGLLTVVETKLAKSPEARRTVVGQIIEYASYIYEWTADSVYEVAEAYLKSDRAPKDYKNLSLYEALRKLGGISPEAEDEFSADKFRDSIEQNLRKGKIRLLIAVDELVEPLRATVTFLNRNSNFDILLLQVRSFEESKTRKVLIPTLFGYTKPPTGGGGERHYWTEKEFLEDVDEKCEREVAKTIRELLEFAKSKGKIKWGTGKLTGSFTFYEPRMGLSIFSVYSSGDLGLNPGWMIAWQGVKEREKILESFRAELNQIPGINTLPEGTFYQPDVSHPPQKVQFLTQGDNLELFKNAVLSLCQAIEPGSNTPGQPLSV